MKFGCCIPGSSFVPHIADMQKSEEAENNPLRILRNGCLAVVNQIGFDFAEATVGLLMSMTEEELLKAVEENIKIEAANSFIPASMPIIEGGAKLESFAGEAIRRLALLGGKVIVFGSGGARKKPDGVTDFENRSAIKKFLAICDGYAAEYKVDVVIEPLNKGETNAINTLADGAALVREMRAEGYQNIKLLADAYHMCKEEDTDKLIDSENGLYNIECLGDIAKNSDLLRHIHIAEPKGRKYPGSDGGEYLQLFARELKKINYNGTVSIECAFGDFFSESGAGLDFMKKIF